MAPVDEPRKPPSVFKNTHQEYYWQLKRLYPNFQQTCSLPPTRTKISSSSNSMHQSVNGTSRVASSVNCTNRMTSSVNGTSRVASSVNCTNRKTSSVNGTSIGTPSVNGTSRGTPSANDTSRWIPSVNSTSRRILSAYGNNRETPLTSSTSRGTLLSSGGTAAPHTVASSCVSYAAGSTARNGIASSFVPSPFGSTSPQVPELDNASFHLASAKAPTNNLEMRSSSLPRVVFLSCPAAVNGLSENTNASTMVQIPHDVIKDSGAATGDIKKQKRKRIKRKRISSKVVVDKKKQVRENIRIPQDVPKSLDCSIHEIVQPEATTSAVMTPVMAWLSVASSNAKKKRGWQKFKEKRKERLLDRHGTDPIVPSSLIQENQVENIDLSKGSWSEKRKKTLPSERCAIVSSQIERCVSSINADAGFPTKKVTFASCDSGPSKSTETTKTGVQFSSLRGVKYSTGQAVLNCRTHLAVTKNESSPTTSKTFSNSTILLDCSYDELKELSPELLFSPKSNQVSVTSHHNLPSSTKLVVSIPQAKRSITLKSTQMSLTSHPNPNSSTKLRVVSVPQAKPSKNYTTEPKISSLNNPSRTNAHQGVHFERLMKNKSSASCEKEPPLPLNEPHNLSYPSVMEWSSNSSTSSSDSDSFEPLATSSQNMRIPSFKRKVETTYLVASKKVKLASPDKTLGLDVCYLTSLTKSCTLPRSVQSKKVHFSTGDPGMSVFKSTPTSAENFSSSSGSSSSGPSVISGTPSPVESNKKKVSFVPRSSRSGSGGLMGKEPKDERTTSLKHAQKAGISNVFEVLKTFTAPGKNKAVGSKTRDTALVNLEPRKNRATLSGSGTSTLCEESVIIISPEGKSTCGHSKTNLTATRACSKKCLNICEDVNNNSDGTGRKGVKELSEDEEETSFNTVDLLCSEELERSMDLQNITSQDVMLSEESTCQERSLFVVPHERRRIDKPEGKRRSCRIEFLENSIDLAL